MTSALANVNSNASSGISNDVGDVNNISGLSGLDVFQSLNNAGPVYNGGAMFRNIGATPQTYSTAIIFGAAGLLIVGGFIWLRKKS